MQQTFHYGTKAVLATPMDKGHYCAHRGWPLPADEDPDELGFLVEYLDGGEANHPDHKGYISWSPATVFNDAYQPSGSMSFGHAVEAMKAGHKVARSGWNGKDMWIALTPGSLFDAKHAKDDHAAKHRAIEVEKHNAETGDYHQIRLLPHIDMRSADGSMVVGWLASQTDMLANDWVILP